MRTGPHRAQPNTELDCGGGQRDRGLQVLLRRGEQPGGHRHQERPRHHHHTLHHGVHQRKGSWDKSKYCNYLFAAHIEIFSAQTTTRFWEVFGEEPKFKMFTVYDKHGTIPESAITLSRPKDYR